jgi:hypothetical protein
MRWGQIEILAFGDASKRWVIYWTRGLSYFATPGLHLRLTEGEFVVHVLIVSENEFKAWLPAEQEPDVVYPTYGLAVSAAFGLGVEKKPWKKIGSVSRVFVSILNHFAVGTPQRTKESFYITAEGERLRPPPISKKIAIDVPNSRNKRTKTGDDDVDSYFVENDLHQPDIEGIRCFYDVFMSCLERKSISR